ncbi:MAG: aminoglycoside phosphotransferase family protein [Erysipelothrix sp.]|nr:aminoglycoside phosphotransferase family protein [Erysipelothrix sp.]
MEQRQLLIEKYHYQDVQYIHKGWSVDQKWIGIKGQEKHLIRISDISMLHRRKWEFDQITRLYQQGWPVNQPLQFIEEEDIVLGIYTYIEAEDLETNIHSLPESMQYDLGYFAGEALSAIHGLPIETDSINQYERMSKKMLKHIDAYIQKGLHFHNDHLVIEHIKNNLHLLSDRPLVFQHGDYHINNMLLIQFQHAAIIDFNRCDIGDPYEEFERAYFFSRKQSIPFVIGQLDGYFKFGIPDEFHQLMKLYMCHNMISALTWSTQFSLRQTEQLKEYVLMIMDDYDQLQRDIPKWLNMKKNAD